MTRYEALMAVRNNFPSEQAMADALGVTQPTIWRWVNQSKQLPAEYVIPAAVLTGVSPYDLRDDIYPRDIMIDGRAGFRFEGVDRQAFDPVATANRSTRIHATRDFNRGGISKAAAQ